MTDQKKSNAMGAAECARRTGLTVRTLRIYERLKLIEPMRTAKGWRCYGPRELQRINIIVTMKAFGMTLEQIRTQLATNPPPLARVLEMQLQTCNARRDAADKAVGLIKAALATIKAGKQLPPENLCDLTRSMEMENQFATYQIFRELANETITPDEERSVMTWVAARPPGEIKHRTDSAPALRAVRSSIKDLLDNGVDPAAAEAQACATRENELVVQNGLRELPAAMFEWNAPLAQKWLQMTDRVAWRSAESTARDETLLAYYCAIRAASPWHRALAPLVDNAAALADKKAPPSSETAQNLAGHVRQICTDYALGDPLVYVRNARAMQFRWPDEDIEQKRKGWAFLAQAIDAIARQ